MSPFLFGGIDRRQEGWDATVSRNFSDAACGASRSIPQKDYSFRTPCSSNNCRRHIADVLSRSARYFYFLQLQAIKKRSKTAVGRPEGKRISLHIGKNLGVETIERTYKEVPASVFVCRLECDFAAIGRDNQTQQKT